MFWQSLNLQGRFILPKTSAGKIFWQSPNLLEDLPPYNFCWQNFWQSPNMLADIHPNYSWQNFSDSHQICQHLVTKSAGRFIPQNFWWQIFWQSPNLLADSLLADLLTGRLGEPGADTPQFLLKDFLTVTNFLIDSPLADLLTGRFGEPAGRIAPISAGRFSDSHQVCWQIYPPTILLADFLTITRSAARITPKISAGKFSDSY